jgi:2-polyprenyl-3-methyl-5-hydroxy-6-metoxy-1,4-benzoquinol methylase
MSKKLRLLLRPRAALRAAERRFVLRRAPALGLYAYPPPDEHAAKLAELTEWTEDARQVHDKRPTTAAGNVPDLTITVEGLEDVLAGRPLAGVRVLEVGPKYGIHSRWLDTQGAKELVFSDFPADRELHAAWTAQLSTPHRFVYGDLRTASELLELPQFDLVLFLGVLYHSAHHLPLLATLNRATKLGGTMLLETTFDPRPESSVRLRWHPETGKAKAVPTLAALRVMLAWTGWRRVTRFTDYRPASSEAILLCEKTDELSSDTEFAPVVPPHRSAPVTSASEA